MRKNNRTKRKWTQADNKVECMRINTFCKENGIRNYGDSFYFTINGQKYRVSNHTVYESNRKAYDKDGNQIRKLYHPDGEEEDMIYIHAGKRRLIGIYNALKDGVEVTDTMYSKKGLT